MSPQLQLASTAFLVGVFFVLILVAPAAWFAACAVVFLIANAYMAFLAWSQIGDADRSAADADACRCLRDEDTTPW